MATIKLFVTFLNAIPTTRVSLFMISGLTWRVIPSPTSLVFNQPDIASSAVGASPPLMIGGWTQDPRYARSTQSSSHYPESASNNNNNNNGVGVGVVVVVLPAPVWVEGGFAYSVTHIRTYPCTHEYTSLVIGLVSYTGWIKRFRVPLLLRLWRENRGKIDGSNSTAQTTRVVVPNSERFFRTFVISRTIDDNLNYFFLHSINSRGKMIMNHIDLWLSCLFFFKGQVVPN